MAFLGGISVKKFGDLLGGDTTGRQLPSGYDELDIDLKLKTKITEGGILTAAFQNVGQTDVPVFHKIQLENFERNHTDKQRRALAYLRYDHDLNQRFIQKLFVLTAYHGQFEARSSRKNNSKLTQFERDSTHSWSFQTGIESKIRENWHATTGIDLYAESVKSTRFDDNNGILTNKRGLYPNDAVQQNMAIYTLHQLDFGSNWHAHFGGRWNGFSVKIDDKDIGKTNLTPSALVWNAAILRGVGAHLNFFVAANSSFRAPNVDDLGTLGIVDFRYELPNYDLQPERALSFQIGSKIRFERLRGEVYFFRNDLKNLITRVRRDTQRIANYPVFIKENVEQGYIQGFEISLNGCLLKTDPAGGGITFAFNGAYTYGQNKTKNEPLRRIPPVNGRFALNFEQKMWSISAEILAATAQTRLAAGDKSDNRIPMGGTPAWQILNLYGNFQWRFLHFSMGATNLFNQDYRYHGSGINGVGRSIWLAGRVQF
ncbi:MAG: TonB-dependent receptor [Saprospiraceae bacterium]|nr:TonB-dependent receptor [Saprospiraceae bacterium]